MKVTQLYFEDTTFGKTISSWAESIGIETIKFDSKKEQQLESIQGLLLFHENHDIDRAQQELLSIFEHSQRGISKIDINGTLSVATSNFSLWLDRNKCKVILATGADELTKNPNLERFLEQLKTA
ncbi:MAG: hypothetical protein E6Q37_00225 [Crocinitomicaceae bacterium]|jgi:hypothetical protein|nr:MAG: hypothetical protein E6Q37_00225 [Crocinitomicaceae bacterium]